MARSRIDKPRFKLFASAGEIGLGRRLAKTRGRLVAVVLTGTAISVAYWMLTAGFMRSHSQSVVLNLFLIGGAMLFVIVSAYLQALLAGDLLFGGDWRERVLLGKTKAVDDDEEDALTTVRRFRDRTIHFYLAFGLLLAFNYLLFGLSTGGFLSEYHDWGYFNTLLRSESSEDRVRGLRGITYPTRTEAQQAGPVRNAVVVALGDPDAEVQGWAIWVAGKLQLVEAAPALRAMVRSESLSDEVRARAAESLGQLGDEEGANLMASLLVGSVGRDELALGLLRGLGLARLPGTAAEIARFLNVEPVEIRAHAYWALGRTGNTRFRDSLLEAVSSSDDQDRCFAAEALKYMATRDDLVNAHTLFATAPMTPCQGVTWVSRYHWDEDQDTRLEIVVEESLRAKFLKMVFAAGGASERDFFAAVANDMDEPEEIRALARELALRIDHQR
jgi:hypothetical protein